MEIIFLGTSAAEGLPAPFCSCEVCSRARTSGGKNLRLRSSLLVDGVLKIDHGPDAVAQSHKLGLSLETVRAILFTHTHEDHLDPGSMLPLVPPFTRTLKRRFAVYGPGGVSECIAGSMIYFWVRDVLDFHPLNPFVSARTDDGYTILPLLANHVPEKVCLNYLVTDPAGKTLLYALDTGPWPHATWEYLTTERPKIHLAVMEATFGMSVTNHGGVHMNFKDVFEHRRRLLKLRLLAKDAPFIVTHFSHNGCSLHDEMAEALKPEGIEPAFDGLRVKL